MKSLWNQDSVEAATKGEVRGHFHASRVEIDSRKVQLGDLFVAIKGERVDGHHYVADALSRGAVAVVVSYVPEGISRTASIIIVPDTMQALRDLAAYARERSKAKIVGITGSVGKTSTKEMMKIALAAHGKTYATTGNYNNHIGVPLNLANLAEDAAFGVFEMGMNHAGEIAHLTQMVKPHVAIITSVDAVHLEFFESVQGIADAKAEIFEGVQPEGAAILNADNKFYAYLVNKAREKHIKRVIAFGEAAEAGARLVFYQPTSQGAVIRALIAEVQYEYRLGASGKHLACNSLAVLAACHALQLPVANSASALAAFTEVDGRGAVLSLPLAHGEFYVMDDSYNASPASMRAAFVKLDEAWELAGKKGRKIAVLGDMLELGNEAPAHHAALSEALQACAFDAVFTAGVLMKYMHDALPKEKAVAHVMEAKQLLPILQKHIMPNDYVLIKGSHGSKIYELVKQLQEHYTQEHKHAL